MYLLRIFDLSFLLFRYHDCLSCILFQMSVLLEIASLASSSVSYGNSKEAANFSCIQSKRHVFTPVGSFAMHAFVVYALPSICIFGIIGNILTFIIMNESSQRIVGHFFIKILTIFDSLSLIFVLPAMWTVLMVRPYHHHLDPYSTTWADIVTTGWGWCQTRVIATFFTRTLSIYTIILFTLERCIKMTKPFVAKRLCTVSNAKKSIIFLVIFALVTNIHYAFAFTKLTIKTPCGKKVVCKTNTIFFQSRYFTMTLHSVIPSIIIIVCNVIIVYRLHSSSKNIYRQHVKTCEDEDHRSHMKGIEIDQQREITLRLLLVSFAFFILNFPLFIVTSAHSYSELTEKRFHLSGAWADAFIFVLLLFVLNLAINFFLYCFTGKLFRRAAINLFLCRMKEFREFRARLSGFERRSSTSIKTSSSYLQRSSILSRNESQRDGRQLLSGQPSMVRKETNV